MLYPLKFKSQYKTKIWGGNKIRNILKKGDAPMNCGESWEISAIQGNISVVDNGFLKGNNLQEIIEVYMADLIGEKVYEKFGMEFPLLIKFIDASDDLSIQVHPDDELAKKRHSAYGKTEMWYVLQADKEANLISGFNKKSSKGEYLEMLKKKSLTSILNVENVKKGDVFYIPAGRIHAIGPGVLLTEIQQTSDVTYRIYDWDRKGNDGKTRELHTDLALDAINFDKCDKAKTQYSVVSEYSSKVVQSEFFNVNILKFKNAVEKDYNFIDSFIIYICTEGQFVVDTEDDQVSVKKGETVLIPANIRQFALVPEEKSEMLEVYISL